MIEELIERIEALEGPSSRELVSVFEQAFEIVHGDDWAAVNTDEGDRFGRFLSAEAWLDAAMSLVPEGWDIAMMKEGGEATVALKNPMNPNKNSVGKAEGLAPALCAAALRSLSDRKG